METRKENLIVEIGVFIGQLKSGHPIPIESIQKMEHLIALVEIASIDELIIYEEEWQLFKSQ